MSYANSVDPDQTPLFTASDLDLRCLPMSHFIGTQSINVLIEVCIGINRDICKYANGGYVLCVQDSVF